MFSIHHIEIIPILFPFRLIKIIQIWFDFNFEQYDTVTSRSKTSKVSSALPNILKLMELEGLKLTN